MYRHILYLSGHFILLNKYKVFTVIVILYDRHVLLSNFLTYQFPSFATLIRGSMTPYKISRISIITMYIAGINEGAGNNNVIVIVCNCIDHQHANARNTEYFFNDHGSCQQVDQQRSHDCNNRNQSIPQCMFPDDLPLRQPFACTSRM
jgi:hypothetical protein